MDKVPLQKLLVSRKPRAGEGDNLVDLLRRSVKAGQLYSRPGDEFDEALPPITEAVRLATGGRRRRALFSERGSAEKG